MRGTGRRGRECRPNGQMGRLVGGRRSALPRSTCPYRGVASEAAEAASEAASEAAEAAEAASAAAAASAAVAMRSDSDLTMSRPHPHRRRRHPTARSTPPRAVARAGLWCCRRRLTSCRRCLLRHLHQAAERQLATPHAQSQQHPTLVTG